MRPADQEEVRLVLQGSAARSDARSLGPADWTSYALGPDSFRRGGEPSTEGGSKRALLLTTAVALAVIAAVELAWAIPMLASGGGGRSGSYGNSSSSGGSGGGGSGAVLAATTDITVGDAAKWPTFLVLGDWGRDGKHKQSSVADAMAEAARRLGVDFVVSTGDNFYERGLISPEDPQFDTSFKNIYHHDSLQVPFYSVLGNHDYGEIEEGKSEVLDCPGGPEDDNCFLSPLHELDARLTARDARWRCARSFRVAAAGGRVELFFMDTSPLMSQYANVSWRSNRGGLADQSPETSLQELGAALARSAADWRLVMYLSGHDHNLQHLVPPGGYHQVISGAGSKIGHGFHGKKHSLFQYDHNGFAAVRMGPDTATVEYYGLDGTAPLFTVQVPRTQ